MKPIKPILTLCLLACLLIAPAAAAAASVTDASGTTYITYDQIYASSLSSSEKLALVQEMSGWTDELAAYVEWKYSGGDETTTSTTSTSKRPTTTSTSKGTSSTYTTGLTTGTTATSTYTEEEQAALDAQYDDYLATFAANYQATARFAGSGAGTASNPYIITTQSELQAISDDLTAHYKLANDIVISGTWNPIGTTGSGFSGSLNGDGHTIDGINNIFSYINGCTITNTNFININIVNSGSSSAVYSMLLSGSSGGIYIDSCSFQGRISATTSSRSTSVIATVLVYQPISESSSSITNCVFDVDINAISTSSNPSNEDRRLIATPIMVHGGTVSDIYNIGNIESELYASGIAGSVYGRPPSSISNSVVLGEVTTSSTYDVCYRLWASGGGEESSPSTLTNNYAASTIPVGGTAGANGVDGASVTASTYQTQSFWEDTLGWDFDSVWYWDESENLPKLQAFLPKAVSPTISAISATPATGGQTTDYTLSVTASTEGSGGIASYQWYFSTDAGSTWDAISGATAATYTFTPGTQFVGDVLFKAVVTGADGGVVDSYDAGYTDVKITVVMAPQISDAAASPTSGPLSQTVTLSADVSSTVTATYQWQELVGSTWTDISGATSATSTVSVSDTSATTHSYRLVATNVGGSATSSTVTYMSVAVPVISSPSASPTSGPLSQSVTLSASVSGADSVQWQELKGSTWTAISGATSATSTVSVSDSSATTHSYRLVATNIGGSATSSTVTYTSVAVPVISSPSASPTSGPLSQTVTLSASVSGADSVQWQELKGSTWTDISGATSATASVSVSDSSATTHSYRLVATNIGGTTTGATVTYQSVAAPVINSASASPTSGPLTQTVTLTASVSGADSVQWQELKGSTWTAISGATSATSTVSVSDSSATLHSYRLVATNIGGTTTGATVTYQSVAAPVISSASASPTSGPLTQTVTLTASISGATSYQWQELIGSTWTDISGATSATASVSVSDSEPTEHQYRLKADNIGGTTYSETVTYQSSEGPLVSDATANPTAGPLTQTVTLSATATSDYTITYQWQELISGSWTNINGATAATSTVSITDTTGTLHRYRLLATDTGGTTPSATVTYQSYAPPTVTGASVNPATGKYTETITLDAAVTGADSLQWQRQTGSTWENIEGATTETWIGALTFSGDTNLRLKASNIGGTTYSSTITYTIAGPANIQTLTASPNVVSLPGTTTLTITGTNIVSVEWQKLVSGTWTTIGTGLSLTENPGSTPGTISYRALVEGADGTTVTSNTIEVLTGYAPTVEITSPADNAEFNAGATITAAASVTGTDVVSQWSFGSGGEGDILANPSTVTYSTQGYKTITIYAESIFGSASDTVKILYGKAPRPMQTELFDEVDTSPVDNFVNQFDVQPGEMPNPVGIMESLFQPFDDALKGFFWVLVFGAIMLVVWLITKSVALPSVLGVLFGAFMVGFMPDMYLMPAVALIAAGMAGGVLYVIKRN